MEFNNITLLRIVDLLNTKFKTYSKLPACWVNKRFLNEVNRLVAQKVMIMGLDQNLVNRELAK